MCQPAHRLQIIFGRNNLLLIIIVGRVPADFPRISRQRRAEDRLCANRRQTGTVSVSSCGLRHKPHAIAVRRNLRIAGIEFAPIDIVVVPGLILIRDEIDAGAALLVAARLLLKLQGLPYRRVLRCRCQMGKSGKWNCGQRRNTNLEHFSTRMFRLIFHCGQTSYQVFSEQARCHCSCDDPRIRPEIAYGLLPTT
jgi:hypothetical protein